MKLIHQFSALTSITSSSENVNFPFSNILKIEPWVRGKFASYADDQWIQGQCAGSVSALFVNQVNFPQFRFQWNSTAIWTSPTIDLVCSPVKDRAKNRKGWFEFAPVTDGYWRILVAAGQTLDNAEAVPALGNVILGTPYVMPINGEASLRIEGKTIIEESYAGGYQETGFGRKRHVISVPFGDDMAPLQDMPIDWTNGVLFYDMGRVEQSFLVFPPANLSETVYHLEDTKLTLEFREKP